MKPLKERLEETKGAIEALLGEYDQEKNNIQVKVLDRGSVTITPNRLIHGNELKAISAIVERSYLNMYYSNSYNCFVVH